MVPASGPVERMIGDSVRANGWSAGVVQTAGQICPEWLVSGILIRQVLLSFIISCTDFFEKGYPILLCSMYSSIAVCVYMVIGIIELRNEEDLCKKRARVNDRTDRGEGWAAAAAGSGVEQRVPGGDLGRKTYTGRRMSLSTFSHDNSIPPPSQCLEEIGGVVEAGNGGRSQGGMSRNAGRRWARMEAWDRRGKDGGYAESGRGERVGADARLRDLPPTPTTTPTTFHHSQLQHHPLPLLQRLDSRLETLASVLTLVLTLTCLSETSKG